MRAKILPPSWKLVLTSTGKGHDCKKQRDSWHRFDQNGYQELNGGEDGWNGDMNDVQDVWDSRTSLGWGMME
jgi:hypothetical protein